MSGPWRVRVDRRHLTGKGRSTVAFCRTDGCTKQVHGSGRCAVHYRRRRCLDCDGVVYARRRCYLHDREHRERLLRCPNCLQVHTGTATERKVAAIRQLAGEGDLDERCARILGLFRNAWWGAA